MPRYVSRLGTTFLFLILTGFLLANNILIAVSIIPLCLMAIGYFIDVPGDIGVIKSISKDRARVGEVLDISLDISIESGFGLVIICDILYGSFELVEGNNFHVMWKGLTPKKAKINYRMRCTSSGTYSLDVTKWRSKHPVCDYSESGECHNEISLKIVPRLLELHKIRGLSAKCRVPMPQGALSTLGMTTHEFKEVRMYYPGDPFKSINWKVTSRNLFRGKIQPVVNEFEKEGKKTVYIFLDTSPTMNYGTKSKNVIEYSIEAVNGLADHYLGQNCIVSLISFGDKKFTVHAGAGKRQYHRILRELMKIRDNNEAKKEIKKKITGLNEVVYSNREHFSGVRPLFIVVTRFCGSNCETLKKAIEDMSKYTMRNGNLPSIMIINIIGYEMKIKKETERQAAGVLEAFVNIMSKELRNQCIWIDWNPERESLTSALLKQVVTAR
ncbi:DUF58 domain-containing protein [Acetivibrio cellulolyticus]|uniref:DUF58 domain-containing protein n=1 Tax=Acetivibrio cellulolyticus TaxID=35830 RepID=UPI0001E2DE2E|nr:DUF58 domain-containing protein [Acetivibrio cellulolyticus]